MDRQGSVRKRTREIGWGVRDVVEEKDVETARNRRNLLGGAETWCSGNFLEYMMVNLVKTSCNEGNRVCLAISHSPTKLLAMGLGYTKFSCFLRGVPL